MLCLTIQVILGSFQGGYVRSSDVMKRLLRLIITCTLFAALITHAALASDLIVGVNDYELGSTKESQDAALKQLKGNGVKTIRISLFANTTDLIIRAYKEGISTDAIVYPHIGTSAKSRGGWAQFRLTEVTPQEFTEGFKPILDKLEAAGVLLTAIELGNEINTAGYNGDIPEPGSGRVLGLADLNNPNDPEGPAIANGFRNYLRIMEALKNMRDHSKVNRTTPILSGASGDWGLPSAKSRSKQLGVSVPDAIEFLQENGMDKLVDGYAVHVYPSGDPHRTVAMRIESLEKYGILSECKSGGKPCWLTEWGFPNPSRACPIEGEAQRTQVIQAQRDAFRHFVEQGRLAAIIYYTWTGPATKFDPMSVFRCGALTDAGKLALSPM
jgi:hypothetical protein